MAAYVLVRINVTDSEKLKPYQAVAASIVEKYGGKLLARGGRVVTLEGTEENRRIVMMEFPDIQTAEAFYRSEEYTRAIALREGAAEFEIIAVEGVQ